MHKTLFIWIRKIITHVYMYNNYHNWEIKFIFYSKSWKNFSNRHCPLTFPLSCTVYCVSTLYLHQPNLTISRNIKNSIPLATKIQLLKDNISCWSCTEVTSHHFVLTGLDCASYLHPWNVQPLSPKSYVTVLWPLIEKQFSELSEGAVLRYNPQSYFSQFSISFLLIIFSCWQNSSFWYEW